MWLYYLIIVLGFVFLFATSSLMVNAWLPSATESGVKISSEDDQRNRYVGKIIGRCENVLIYIFMSSGHITGLALIFSAKTLVRKKQIEDNPDFFLIGSMVNFTYSVIVALVFNFAAEQVCSFYGMACPVPVKPAAS